MKSWIMLGMLCAALTSQNCIADTQDERLVAALVLHTADWSQTRWMGKHQDKFYETNPILGKYPKAGEVNRYFLGTAAIMTTLHYVLPPRAAKMSDYIWISVETGAVAHNISMGVRFEY
jgi:hypothetical protein